MKPYAMVLIVKVDFLQRTLKKYSKKNYGPQSQRAYLTAEKGDLGCLNFVKSLDSTVSGYFLQRPENH